MNSWSQGVFIRVYEQQSQEVFIRCSYGVHIDQSPRELSRALVGKILKVLGQKNSKYKD